MTAASRRPKPTKAPVGVKAAWITAGGAILAAAVGAWIAGWSGKSAPGEATAITSDTVRLPVTSHGVSAEGARPAAHRDAIAVRLDAKAIRWVGDGPQRFALEVTLEGRSTRTGQFERLDIDSIQRDSTTVGHPLHVELRADDVAGYDRFRVAVRLTCGASLDVHEVQRNEFAAPDMNAPERWIYDHPAQLGWDDGLYCGLQNGPVFFPFRIVANWT